MSPDSLPLPLIDIILLCVVLISTLLGAIKGFAGVVISLGGWALALFLGSRYAAHIAEQLPAALNPPSLRLGAAFAIIFALVLMVSVMTAKLSASAIKGLGLGPSDRFFGFLFGLARGGLIVVAFVLLAGMTPVINDPWWGESRVIAVAEPASAWLLERLPPLPIPELGPEVGPDALESAESKGGSEREIKL
ncbi:MAG: CvpA family protein [Gammaproteobacteria bacterium]